MPSPYVGTRPFDQTDEDQSRFFGRETELDEIVSLIYSQPIVLVYAQSGAGKTSLFNAGVVPKLTEAGFQVLPVARVGGALHDPPECDESCNMYVYNALLAMHPHHAAPSELRQMRLADFLSGWPRLNDGPRRAARVIAFDQFEEIFTLYSEQSYDLEFRGFRW